MTSAALPFADTRQFFALYASGEHQKLCEVFLSAFNQLEKMVFLEANVAAASVNPFLKSFLTIFTQADFTLPEPYVVRFICQNALISNLAAMSSFNNTDAFLEILRRQPSNFVKILTLYSARNRIQFDRSGFFNTNAMLASVWYCQYCAIYKSGVMQPEVATNLTAHLSAPDSRLLPAMGLCDGYYASTYVDGGLDRIVKPHLNRTIRDRVRVEITAKPDPKKIAVISDFWSERHSVYRNYAAYVRELKKDFHLTLFHILIPKEQLDTSMFDEVQRLDMAPGRLQEQLNGGYQVAYFPDIGMTDPSIWLANCRIAPIQISSPGHSVSSWGAEIDYFMSGKDVEPTENPERNYSEKLVLLPGMGAIHNKPLYSPVGATKKITEILINCPWSGHKITGSFLHTLRRLIERTSRPVRLRIFPNTGIVQYNGSVPFMRDLQRGLGPKAQVEIRPSLPYREYMQLMEEGDLTLDSFHFGGCNSVADSLFLLKPTVVWEGDKWYNRIGPATLRLVGLDEYICQNEDEFIEKSLLLIESEKERAKVKAKLEDTDLNATLFSTEHAPAFSRAVKHLIANHAKLKSQGTKPIAIASK